jgi:hypothetical protein
MRVTTTSGVRNIYVVLRDYALNNSGDYTVNVFNKNTQSETEILLTGQTEAIIVSNMNQLKIELSNTYSEGDEVSFYVTGTAETKVLHRNKILFTDQVPQDYNIDG